MPATPPSEFDRAVAVRARPDSPGMFDAAMSEGWSIGGAVNGGVQIALAANALRATLADRGHPDPISVSAYYLSAGRDGPAEVEATVVRSGGRTSVAQAVVRQDDEERIRVLATFSDLEHFAGDVRTTATRPPIAAPAECFSPADAPPAPPGGTQPPPIMSRLDMRFDPASIGWAIGAPSGEATMQAWVGFADGRDHDPLSLLFAADALPPVSLELGCKGWAPTLELTVHVRARPAPGPVQVRHVSRNVAGGHFEEDAEVWDSAGRLVAQARQLALLPRPV